MDDVADTSTKTTGTLSNYERFVKGGIGKWAQSARGSAGEKRMILDKIKEYQIFFEGIEAACGNAADISPFIKKTCVAILEIYKLCENQKKCRDTLLILAEDIDSILIYRAEELGVINEVSTILKMQGMGITSRFLLTTASTSSELEDLRIKLKKAIEGLKDSMNSGRSKRIITYVEGHDWERVEDNSLKSKLSIALNPRHNPGECCLEGTRTSLLTTVDKWIRGFNGKKTVWIYGHAGSGKSALLNSVTENLEDAGIPFTCFDFKLDDPDLTNVHEVLPTIAYSFAEHYGDYRNFITDSNTLKLPVNYPISAMNVEKQSELLFGKTFNLISSLGAKRPSIHVLLIDALDECRNRRDRSRTLQECLALLNILLSFADQVPWIKFLVASRPEPAIANFFKDTSYSVHHIDVNDDKWRTSAAIRLFISDTSEKLDLGLSHDQIERLQERASGLFVWCTTALRYIKGCKEGITHAIEYILKDQPVNSKDDPYASLYLLYQHILDSAVSEIIDKELMELVLGVVFITSTRRPLSAAAITDIIYHSGQNNKLEKQRERIDNVIESLSAILFVEEGSNAVRTRHVTVLDYIEIALDESTPARTTVQGVLSTRPFSIGLTELHTRMFEACNQIMERELRFNICELEDPHRMNKDIPDLYIRISRSISEALQYSILFWMSHFERLEVVKSSGQVFAFLKSSKALYWIEGLSLLGVIDQGILILQDCAEVFASQADIVDLAKEWTRFLTIYGDALQSTPHLYLSAISWVPRNSRLWYPFHECVSSELPIISNIPKRWHDGWVENVGTSVMSVAYSSHGHLIVAGCKDGALHLREAHSGKVARESFLSESFTLSTAFSPDDSLLASGHDDGNVRLWNLQASLVSPKELVGHSGACFSVAFSSDGEQLVSGSYDMSIRVWDVKSGKTVGAPIKGHDSFVSSVTFSADDTLVVSGSADKTVRIWDKETGGQVGKLQHLHPVYSVTCSRDGKYIATGSQRNITRLWDAHTYKQCGAPLVGCFDDDSDVRSVCFSIDSKYVASCSLAKKDNAIRLWSAESRSLFCELRGHTGGVRAVAFSPSGNHLLSGSDDNTVRVWDIEETSAANTISQPTSCITYTPDGNFIASGSRDGKIHLWDIRTGAAVGRSMEGHTSVVNALAVSGDGQWIVSGSGDNSLRIWDISLGTMLGEPMLGHTAQINSVAVSSDNQFIVSASDDKTVRLWHATRRNLIKTFDGHEDKVTFVAFFNGTRIISASWDATIRTWDIQAGKNGGKLLRSYLKPLNAVAISLDGRWIASGLGDGTVHISSWRRSARALDHVLESHSELVASVAFSPNSEFLIASLIDNRIRAWNVQTRKIIGSALIGPSAVHTVAFSPKSNEFVSGSADGSVRIWDTRAHIDQELYSEGEASKSQHDEEKLRIRWNTCRAHMVGNDGWIRDGEKLLFWVPWWYRLDISGGVKLVIGSDFDTIRPEVDYRKIFRYSGMLWTHVQREDLATVDVRKETLENGVDLQLGLFARDIAAGFDARAAEMVLREIRVSFGLTSITLDEMESSTHQECMPGTREDWINQIIDWLLSETEESVFWIYGIPGSGKSAIAQTIARHPKIKNYLKSHIFFKRDSTVRHDIYSIVAYRLAMSNAAVALAIARRLDKPRLGPRDTFTNLILEPLLEAEREGKMEEPIVIILDALDEFGTPESRGPFLQLISDDFSKLPRHVRFLITSRPELDLVYALTNHKHIREADLEVDTEESRSDVQNYIATEMKKIVPDKAISEGRQWEKMMLDLGLAADGLFIWASVAIRLVRFARRPYKKICELTRDKTPLTLDDLYRDALTVAAIDWDDEGDRDFFAMLFSLILPNRGCITVELFDLLLPFGGDSSGLFLHGLQCFASSGRHKSVQVHHKSFSNYLRSDKRKPEEPWYIDAPHWNNFILIRCLMAMEGLQYDLCGAVSGSGDGELAIGEVQVHIIYASLYWADHLKDAKFSPEALELLRKFLNERLLFWFEILSLLKEFSRVAETALTNAINWVSSHSPETVAFLEDARSIVSKFAKHISKSPMFIYSTALPFTTSINRVSQQYSNFHEKF